MRRLAGETGLIVSVDLLVLIAAAAVIGAAVVGALLGPLRSLHERAVTGVTGLNETGF